VRALGAPHRVSRVILRLRLYCASHNECQESLCTAQCDGLLYVFRIDSCLGQDAAAPPRDRNPLLSGYAAVQYRFLRPTAKADVSGLTARDGHQFRASVYSVQYPYPTFSPEGEILVLSSAQHASAPLMVRIAPSSFARNNDPRPNYWPNPA
jgi:hypothetical protein